MTRPLSERERTVLDALLAVEFDGVEALREQAREAQVVGGCGCGCPSIDFSSQRGDGMGLKVNAALRGSYDGLFLFTLGDRLGGIEYVSSSDEMAAELPDPSLLDIKPY